jgi:hypothetical protein
MSIRFPSRRADGSFDLIVRIRMGAVASRLATWLSAWAEQNATWERRWESGGRIEREVLRFTDDFSAPPTFQVCDDGTIAILFRVRSTAMLWKDWSGKVYDDLRKEYGDHVQLVGVEVVVE